MKNARNNKLTYEIVPSHDKFQAQDHKSLTLFFLFWLVGLDFYFQPGWNQCTNTEQIHNNSKNNFHSEKATKMKIPAFQNSSTAIPEHGPDSCERFTNLMPSKRTTISGGVAELSAGLTPALCADSAADSAYQRLVADWQWQSTRQ